jgi:fatty-acyl-CoA synthase
MVGLRTLPQMLADAARTDAGMTLLAGARETHRTYAELRQTSYRIARAMQESGLKRGDLVALVLSDPEQFVTALFGASIAGIVPASVYPPATTVDLDRYFDVTARTLRASGARGIVTNPGLASGFSTLRDRCPGLQCILVHEELDAPPLEENDCRSPSLDDLAFVQFTSGSTATPKGVALTHRNVSANIDALAGPDGLCTGSDDVVVTWLPLYHDMGLVGMTIGALAVCRPVVIMTPQAFVKRPVDWLRAISQYHGTISFAPTFGYDLCVRRLKEGDLDGLNLSCWRVAGCGAEPIHAPTLAAFATKLAPAGFRASSLVPSYGLAEHVVAATLAPMGRAPLVERIAANMTAAGDAASLAASEDIPGVEVVSCGRPLPGHQLRIVGPDGGVLPERQVGEVVLAGPSVMVGYYKQDALTALTVRDGWLHTGDLGYLADGELFVCGRAKDLIIVNGRKYHPQDLEWAVEEVAGVPRGRVVAFGVNDPGYPDRVVIMLESRGTVPSGLTDSIRRRIGDLFGLSVDAVAFVPAGTVGRTTSGKVQRAAARARYERGELSFGPPGSDNVGPGGRGRSKAMGRADSAPTTGEPKLDGSPR